MMNVLVIAEHNNSELNPSTLNTVSAGQQIGSVDLAIIGNNCQSVANVASKIEGINNVILAEAEHYTHSLAEELAPLITELAKEYTHILAPSTSFGKNLAPRVAALLDVAQASDVIEISSENSFIRPIYAGNALSHVSLNTDKKVLTIRTVSFDSAEYGSNQATIKRVEPLAKLGLSEFVENQLIGSDRPELATAKVVVSGGRGVGSTENFAIIEALADKLDAAVGASRAAVDEGYISNDKQVGQTGIVVAPELYIAIAISGAAQHIAGMKDSKVIVAINKDPDAQIFNYADYGLVADLFEAVPELVKKL